MPPPHILAEYEQVVAGSADRIIATVEAATTERAKTDRILAEGEAEAAKNALSMAFFLALILVVAAISFFAVNKPVAGGILLGLPAVTLIGHFTVRATGKNT
jgi:uncharacterized membrane protein